MMKMMIIMTMKMMKLWK